MKKTFCIVFTVVLSILSNNIYSQTFLDSTFINLNKSQINTGILYDRTFPFSQIAKYNGILDTVCNLPTWRQMYLEIYNSTFNKNNIIKIDSIKKNVEQYIKNNGVIPLLVMDYNYNKIKEHAIDSGLLQLQNKKLFNVEGKSTSPYSENSVFAITPAFNRIFNNVIKFSIVSDFYFSNKTVFPELFQIDFGDGIGYRNVNMDEVITINYSNISNKDIKVIAYYTDKTLISSTKLVSSNCATSVSIDGTPWSSQFGSVDPYKFSALIPFAGHYATGNAYVKYRYGVPANEYHFFRKPLIFVEGLDFGTDKYGNTIDLLNQNGALGWCQFMGGSIDPTDPDAFPQLEHMPELIEALRQDGYDIIVLDFDDGADYIEANAYLLVELIKKVNAYKIGNQSNVVIGASMGGQIVRHALSYMEANNIPHCTREYVSVDSPHKGANIPIGIQRFLEFFGTLGGNAGAHSALDNLDRPAPQEMLVSHYNSSAQTLRNNWISAQNTFGLPKKLRKVAMANGSKNMSGQGFSAGDQLMDYHYSPWWCLGATMVMGDAYSVKDNSLLFAGKVPNNGLATIGTTLIICPPGIACALCMSLGIDFSEWTLYWSGTAPYDNCPGGTRSTAKQIVDQLMNPVEGDPAPGNAQTINEKHSFIPTVSALSVNTNNLFYNVSSINSETPNTAIYGFDAFFAPSSNQEHIYIEPFINQSGNSNWIYNELKRSENKLGLVLNSSSPNSGIFNYGRYESHFISSVTVENGGQLFINANRATDFGTGITPVTNSTYTIETCFCNSVVININNNGKLILGEKSGSINNKAILNINDHAGLYINQNGDLTLNDGSILYIKKGGALYISTGANIILKGNSSIIVEPEGRICVSSGANITLENSNSKIILQPGALSDMATCTNPELITYSGDGEIICDCESFVNYDHSGPNGIVAFGGGTLSNQTVSFEGDITFALNANETLINTTFKLRHGKKIIIPNTATLNLTNNSKITNVCYSKNFEGIIEIQQGGKLILDNSTIHLADNGKIEVQKGGQLIITNSTILLTENSKIDIQRLGATCGHLYFNEGASIVLQDNNTKLEIDGQLHIGNNATFTFTGNGEIFWKTPNLGSNNILCGTNSRFILNGTNNNDVVLHIGSNAKLWPQDNLSRFTITNAKITFDNSSLDIKCKYIFSNVKFYSNDTYYYLSHLFVWGSPNSFINNCEFSGVNIEGTLTYYGYPLKLSNSKFIDNNIAINTIGAGVQLNNVQFDLFTIGWQQVGMTLPSLVKNCKFGVDYSSYNGISCTGSNTTLRVENTEINGDLLDGGDGFGTGIYASGSMLNLDLRCNKIVHNSNSVIVANNATLNMSANFNAGYNDLSSDIPSDLTVTDLPISLDDASVPIISDGYNDIGIKHTESKDWYEPPSPEVLNYNISGTINSSVTSIIMSYNQWWNQDAGTPVLDIKNSYEEDVLSDLVNEFPTLSSTCGLHDNPTNPSITNPIRVCASCTNISTSRFSNVPYNDAVRIAISNMELEDSTKNDLTAIAMFKEILLYPVDLNDPSMKWLSDLAFAKMNTALSNAFATGRVTTSDNTATLHPAVSDVLAVYAKFATTPTQTNYLNQFYLDYAKAQVYRLAGRRDSALVYFNNISNCYIGTEEIRQLNNAKLVTNAEEQIITGQISKQYFDTLLTKLVPPTIKKTEINSTANINNTAKLGQNVKIGANTIIEQSVIIGNNVTIGSNVSIKKETTIKDGTTIGNNTVIEKGNIIGADNIIGNNVTIKKECVLANNVTLADNVGIEESSKIGGFVTIGTNTKLQKEVFIADGTSIGANVNFDKNIKIGSNVTILDNAIVKKEVQVGDRTFIGSNVTINQTAKIGSDVTINNSLTIGSNARISNNKTITTNVANNGQVGTTAPTIPAIPGQVVFNCTFAQANAKVRGNLFYGFTATNENTGILSFGTGDAIKFKANNLSLNYLWNFGDCTTSTEQIPTHTYTKPGVYVITLTETIKCTQIIYTGAITVFPAPNATFTNQQQPLCSASNKYLLNKSNNVGDLHTILYNCQTGLCSNDPTGLDSSFYRVKYHWNFGQVKPTFDETFTLKQIYNNLDSNITCTFPQAGLYPVSLSATLEIKNKSTNIWTATDITKVFTDTIHVGDHIMADFEFTQPACFNDSVYFTDKTQYGKKPYTYSWSFAFHNGSTFANPVHKYATAGIFNISLIATDAIGCKDTAIKQIIIPACPSIFGTLYENDDCGGSPVVGDTIILKDNFSNIVSTVTPAITNSNGEFNFSSNEIQLLDTTALYILSTKSGFELQNITAKSISQWKALSPMSINLKNVNQEWVASYSGILSIYNMATAIDINDNVCVTGTTYGVSNTYDYSTLKYDKDGHLLWTKIYNGIGNGEDRAIGIVIDNNSNIYVSGYSWGGSNMDWATIKYDPSGNVIWVARYNGTGNDYDVPSAMVLDDLGNIYITGSSVGSNSIFDYLTVKYDANGVEQWVSRYDAPTANGLNFARDIKVDNLGNTYITGENGAVGMVEYCTVKYDVNGAQIWVQKYSGQGGGDSHASQLVLDKNNDVYVTGTSSEGGANTNYTTIKYSASGVEQWIKHYNGANNGAVVSAMGIDSDDDIIISGMILQVNPPNNIYNYLTVKYDKNGIEKWTKTFEPSLDNLVGPSSLKVDNSDNIYIAGSIATGATMDYATIKYDKNGELIWSQKFNGVGNGSDGAYDIALSQSNNVYVTGYSWNGNNQDYVTIKYSQCPATASVLRYSNPAYNTESSEDETQILNSKPVVSNAEPSQILNKSEYVNMFPNPNDGNFYFNYSLPENEKCQFTVFDPTSKKVYSIEIKGGKNTVMVNHNNFSNGVYYYQVTAGNRLIKTERLVIAK